MSTALQSTQLAARRVVGGQAEALTGPTSPEGARVEVRNDPRHGGFRLAMAHGQEERLPHLEAHYFADDGHLILFSRIEEILGELAAR